MHTTRRPTTTSIFPAQKDLSKQVRQHPLLSRSAPSHSSSPTFSVSACRDLVFLLSLSGRSCFYCAIFCHFGPRRRGRNAISPPLRPLLWGRVVWTVCWAGEECVWRERGGGTGSRWALIHYWSAPIENLMEILPPFFSFPPHPSLAPPSLSVFSSFYPPLRSYLPLFPYVFFPFLCVSSLVSEVFLFFRVYPRSLQSVFSPSWTSLSTTDDFSPLLSISVQSSSLPQLSL